MRLAIAEAHKHAGRTGSNPAVGAIIVRAGRVIGRGSHRGTGHPHAEIEALRSLRPTTSARGASLFVTLEPCSTKGRTPPCTDAILRAGLSHVVIGTIDPNPANSGRATGILTAGGVRVRSGVLARECGQINTSWNHWISTGLPHVTLKAGLSLDGRIGSHPTSRWITSPEARHDTMLLRSRHQAILVGGGTVREDNPRLTLRGVKGQQPLRVVWTKSGRLPGSCHLLKDGHPTRVFPAQSLRSTLRSLANEGIQSVLIEGGARTHAEALRRRLAHRIVFYISPQLIGGSIPAVGNAGFLTLHTAPTISSIQYEPIGPDLKITGQIEYKEK